MLKDLLFRIAPLRVARHGFSPRNRTRPGSCISILLVCSLLAGCASYRPLPLSSEAVEATLHREQAPLRLAASEIRHPLLPAIDIAADAPLSPEAAAVIAVLANPRLRALRDRRGEASAQLLAAGLLPNPELAIGLDRPTGTTEGAVSALGVGVSWNLASLLSRRARQDAANDRADQVDLEIAWQEWQTAEAAKETAYRLLSLQEQAVLARDVARQTAELAGTLKDAVTAGRAPLDLFRRWKNASRLAKDDLLLVKKERDQARLDLNELLGLPPDAKPAIAGSLDSTAPLPPAAQLLNGIADRRLDLVALRRGYRSREAALRAAVRSQFPSIGIGVSRDRDTDGLQTGGLRIAIELPLFNHHQGRIAIERATRKRLFDEYAARLFAARSQVASLLSALFYEREREKAAEEGATSLRETASSYAEALDEGRIDIVTALAASRDAVTAELGLQKRRLELARARIALELATGFFELPEERKHP